MTRIPPRRPTDAELGILSVLWRRGPSTVREVHDELSETRETGYTTVLKLLQIMTEKGLVERDEARRSHVYAPAVTERETQGHLLGDLAKKAFGGSAASLVMRALDERTATPEELEAIRARLRELADEEDPT